MRGPNCSRSPERARVTRRRSRLQPTRNRNYGAQVAAVKETGFFSEGDKLPEISSASQFESAVFELSNPGDVADRMNIDKGFAIPQYAEKRDPHDAAFEEVKSKVEDAYRVDKAKELAAQRAG